MLSIGEGEDGDALAATMLLRLECLLSEHSDNQDMDIVDYLSSLGNHAA